MTRTEAAEGGGTPRGRSRGAESPPRTAPRGLPGVVVGWVGPARAPNPMEAAEHQGAGQRAGCGCHVSPRGRAAAAVPGAPRGPFSAGRLPRAGAPARHSRAATRRLRGPVCEPSCKAGMAACESQGTKSLGDGLRVSR